MLNQIASIVAPFYGAKNVASKRINALQAAGYQVIYEGVKWDFGTSGTVKQSKEGVLVQVSCATSCKTRNGRHNRCEVYLVK